MDGKIKIQKNTKEKAIFTFSVFSIRLKDTVIQALDNISIETNRSRNELINLFLEYAVNNYEVIS